MYISTLAVVVPVDDFAGKDDKLRCGAVWSKVTGLLLPELGKKYTRFEPAMTAWRQRIDRPFGVILGKADPALFQHIYRTAKLRQEEAIRFHLKGFMDGIDPIVKTERGGMSIYTVNVDGSNEAVANHMLWHVSMISGELLPDGGLYFLAEKESLASDQMEREALTNTERFALCVVTLAIEEGGDGNA